MLRENGAFVTVGAMTHQGEGNVPRAAIEELVESYLGPGRRAGQSTVSDEGPPLERNGGARRCRLRPAHRDSRAGRGTYERSEDDIVASVFSLSSSAPHLFGARLDEFERDLRALLRAPSPADGYRELLRDEALLIRRRD